MGKAVMTAVDNVNSKIAPKLIGMDCTDQASIDGAMNALDDAGSGYDFVPVAGLATEWPFDEVRNPMYCALLFVLLPGACVLLDSFWPIVFAPPLWAYLHGVVVAAEEELLWNAFGATYEAYAAKVPRWQVFGLWSAAMRRSSGAGAQGAEL